MCVWVWVYNMRVYIMRAYVCNYSSTRYVMQRINILSENPFTTSKSKKEKGEKDGDKEEKKGELSFFTGIDQLWVVKRNKTYYIYNIIIIIYYILQSINNTWRYT